MKLTALLLVAVTALSACQNSDAYSSSDTNTTVSGYSSY